MITITITIMIIIIIIIIIIITSCIQSMTQVLLLRFCDILNKSGVLNFIHFCKLHFASFFNDCNTVVYSYC